MVQRHCDHLSHTVTIIWRPNTFSARSGQSHVYGDLYLQPCVLARTSESFLHGGAAACARLVSALGCGTQHGAQSAAMSTSAEPEELHHQETKITEEELRQRKSKAVNAWLEANVGTEKLRLAKILQDHHCLVRGGADNGQKLMDALLEWKAGSITGAS